MAEVCGRIHPGSIIYASIKLTLLSLQPLSKKGLHPHTGGLVRADDAIYHIVIR